MTLYEVMDLTQNNTPIIIMNGNQDVELLIVRKSKEYIKVCPHYEVKFMYPSAKLFDSKHKYCLIVVLHTKRKTFPRTLKEQKQFEADRMAIRQITIERNAFDELTNEQYFL